MVYCFLADGFEEIEALATVDILKRAQIEVKTVGIGSNVIRGAHGISVVTDVIDSDINLDSSLEAVILPGGMPGTLNLQKNDNVNLAIDYAVSKKLLVCAICAAPLILGHKGILAGKKATCYPGFEKDLQGAEVTGEHVVKDGNIITAKGAGVAVDFALEIVAFLKNRDLSDEINASIQSK